LRSGWDPTVGTIVSRQILLAMHNPPRVSDECLGSCCARRSDVACSRP
jgi:hypothetical protein